MSRLTVSFLGTFQVLLDRQPITHFRSTNNQGLLAYLALQGTKPLSRELLAALFWPDEPEQVARNNLRQSLFRLRQMLGDLDNPAQPYLLVTRQAVQFNPDSDFALDVQQFLQAVDEGDLETAVTYYHGDLLPGFTCDSLEFEAWLRQERETLHALALETMLEAGRDCLSNGRYLQTQTIARQQLALEPWREQAHRQLMQSLALAGDRVNALNHFVLCQTVLREELGLEPAPETVTLFEDIKAGRLGAAVADKPIKPPLKVKHNLPTFSSELIGRELDLSQISHLLTQENQRLVSVVGPGGMGKTRLAIAVGAALLEQFRDGVYFVDLAPLTQPDEIVPAIAAVLNYQAPDKSQPLFPQLLTSLRQRQQLLILDNFEHLLAGASLVNKMLQACRDLVILVTSRQRLALVEENRYELGGLNFPDRLTLEDALDFTAVQLFVENGRRVKLDFALTEENVADLVRICQLVQGMPLGLVLAASWLVLLTPAEIATEIEKNLDFLVAELADLPSRQWSMQAVFAYSWQMLTPAEQTVLAKLSVFRGGFTREAAEQVTGANLRVLLALVNKSIVQRNVENGRFTMHELLRQFAAQQRRVLDPHNETLLAHCRYFVGLIQANVWPVDNLYDWAVQNLADKDNLYRAWDNALQNGLGEELIYLSSWWIRVFRNSLQSIPSSRMIQQAIQKLRQRGYAETDKVILWLRLNVLNFNWGFDDTLRIKAELMDLIPIIEKEADLVLSQSLYVMIADALHEMGDLEAITWYDKTCDVAMGIGDETLIRALDAYRLCCRVDFGLQDEMTAGKLNEYLIFFEPRFSRSEIFYKILLRLLRMCRAEGTYEKAIHYGKQCLNVARHWRAPWAINYILSDLAKTYMLLDLPAEAKRQHLDALEWHLAIGQTWQTLGQLYFQAITIPEWLGGQETAVTLLSMITHHNEVAAFHRQLIEEALPQIKAEMGETAFATAWEEGKEMGFETAIDLVRATLQSEKPES